VECGKAQYSKPGIRNLVLDHHRSLFVEMPMNKRYEFKEEWRKIWNKEKGIDFPEKKIEQKMKVWKEENMRMFEDSYQVKFETAPYTSRGTEELIGISPNSLALIFSSGFFLELIPYSVLRDERKYETMNRVLDLIDNREDKKTFLTMMR
jgi:hypothetical protein